MSAHHADSAATVKTAAARVEGWIAAAQAESARGRPDLIEGARTDVEGFAFTRRLLETVIEVSDPFTAALGLRAASQALPDSLPARDRLAMRAGGVASLGLPWAVLPVARRWLRDRVAHLVLSAKLPSAHGEAHAPKITARLDAHTEAGMATLLTLQGDAVLGPDGAAREIERLIGLARLPSVTHLEVDPDRIVHTAATNAGTSNAWQLDADAEQGEQRLQPLLEVARDRGVTILLASNSFRGAQLATEITSRLLVNHAYSDVRIGVRLPAELPESGQAAERIIALAADRVSLGGAPVELTVGVAGFSGREQIDSLLEGLAVPTLDDAEAVSAQMLRIADLALRESGARASSVETVRVAVETEDPLLLAVLTLQAERYSAGFTAQLRAGAAPALAAALVEHGVSVRLRQSIVAPKEFEGSLGYLIGLAAEAANPEGALARSAAFAEAILRSADDVGDAGIALTEGPLAAAQDELVRVLNLVERPFPPSHRTQLRDREWDPSERDTAVFYHPPADNERFDTGGLTAAVLGLGRDTTGQIVFESDGPARRVPVVTESGFACEPDTDASLAENREWARRLLARAASARVTGDSHVNLSVCVSDEDREALLRTTWAAADMWRSQRAASRGVRVGRLALATASARDRLIEVLAVETGEPIAVLDAQVSGVIDAARYIGQIAGGLAAVRGAEFQPDRLALVVADAGVPLAERAEAVLAALAAGSAVVLVAHASVARSSAALIEEWEVAGLPASAVALAVAGDGDTAHVELAADFAADSRVDRAQVLGDRGTARALIRRRPELQIEGRFRELGSMLIAPSADLVTAVRAVVRSAFGAGSRDTRAARALILLGSVARSKRLRTLLADAVRGLSVGDSAAAGTQDPLSFSFGPLPQAPDAAGLRALTELQAGEEWLVEPARLDDEGRLWRPGVRLGVRRDARFWSDAVGMPVIGVASAGSLQQAIELQNMLGGGGTAALFGTDPNETQPWLDGVFAATLTIGGATTTARPGHTPVGGWGSASIGLSPLSGGPNRLVTLGSWELREGTASSTLHLRGLEPEIQAFVELAQESLDYVSFDRVRRAVLADALAWKTELGRVRDTVGLGVELNLLRRWPASTHVRLAEGGSLADLVRVLSAGMLVGAPMAVSTGELLPSPISAFLAGIDIAISLERDDAWLERIAVAGSGEGTTDGELAERVRLIGGDPVRSAEWLGGRDRVPLWAEPVTMAGPVELLVFLREQSISIAAHRHGLAAPPVGIQEWAAELDARVQSP